MFYSHQLLARKAPLGQIWMAATMHAKLNRKKLSKLNIIKICEHILNPSVPMALRLSGILMGGVVIVYQRKVKLLLDDVTRLLVEINEAWKLKESSDPTLLPKGKSQAKRRAITLPKNQEEDLGEIEQSLHYTNASMGFQRTAFIEMRLDNMDDVYVNENPLEDLTTDYHQANTENITLFERFESYEGGTGLRNHFERFDIQEDEKMQVDSVHLDHTEMPSTFVPSPTHREEQKSDEMQEERPAEVANEQSEGVKEAVQDLLGERRQGPAKRRAKIPQSVAMDYKQTIIPGQIYQSWLQCTSDIIAGRPRKRKNSDPTSTMNISRLMELPPTVLYGRLFTNGTTQVYYPAPLLEMWLRSIQPPHDSPSGGTSPPQPPEPSSSSPPERVHFFPPGYPAEDFQSEIGSQSVGVSIEKQRTNVNINEMPADVLMQEFQTNLKTGGVQLTELNEKKANLMTTPGNSDCNMRYFPSSGSGHDLQPHYSEVHSGSKKKRLSASIHSGSSLGPVAEESSWHNPDPDFKLGRLPENGLTPEIDLMVETGPTQTQRPRVLNEPIDHITESIKMQLKAHFDTPGSPRLESLNQLASGMNKKRAAHLFYQTCVLATRDIIRVEQEEAYGDILISRGRKM